MPIKGFHPARVGTPDRCRRSYPAHREQQQLPARAKSPEADPVARRERRTREHGDRCDPSSSHAVRIRGSCRPRAEPTAPNLDRPKRRPVFLQHQHRHDSSRHVTRIPTIASRSTLLPQGRDSQSWERRFSTCSAARVSVKRFSRRTDAITMLMLQNRLEDAAVPPYRSQLALATVMPLPDA